MMLQKDSKALYGFRKKLVSEIICYHDLEVPNIITVGKKTLHFHLEQNFSNYMCGHFLLKLQSGFLSSVEECQMRGNNSFKIAQTSITGLTHWQIYVFSVYIFPHISFSKGCSSVAIETISSLFTSTGSILGDHYCSFPGHSVCVSCPGAAKGKQ